MPCYSKINQWKWDHMNQRVTLYFSIALGILLVGLWIYIADFGEMVQVFRKIQLMYLFPLGISFMAMYFLRSLRWKIILAPVEKITAFESFNLCMTNYFINFLIPMHAGEVAKSLLLKKMKGTPVSKSLLTVYLDKATDLLPIFILLIVAPFLKKQISFIIYLACGILLLIFLLFISTLVFLAFRNNVTITWIERIFFFLPDTLKIKLGNFLSLFVEGLSSISLLKNSIIEIIGLTILALIIHCAFMWLFFLSFGINLPILTILVGYLLLNASFILPAPPGFSGSLELTFVFIFTYLYGYDINLVNAVAAVSHIFIAALFGLLGISALGFIGIKLSTVLKIESESDVIMRTSRQALIRRNSGAK